MSKLPADHDLFIKLAKASEIGDEAWPEQEGEFLRRWGFFNERTLADSEFRFVAELRDLASQFVADRKEL